MICFSEQNLRYYYDLAIKSTVRDFNAKIYLDDNEWVLAAYLYARYEGALDPDIVRRHVEDNLQIASDDSSLLHALVFHRNELNDESLLTTSFRKDKCGRSCIYYTKLEHHIDTLIPLVENKKELENIASYRMRTRNAVALDKFVTENNFHTILRYACNRNLTNVLTELLPKCTNNSQRNKINFVLAMQYPIPPHPLARPRFELIPREDDEENRFLPWLKLRYERDPRKYYDTLTWILNYADGQNPNTVRLVLNCYKALLFDRFHRQHDYIEQKVRVLIDKTPECVRRMEPPDSSDTVRKMCDMIKDIKIQDLFNSHYLYVAVWWLLMLKCRVTNPTASELVVHTLHDIVNTYVDSNTGNTLLHTLCLHSFSMDGQSNKDLWEWAVDEADIDALNQINREGLKAEQLAARSPYMA